MLTITLRSLSNPKTTPDFVANERNNKSIKTLGIYKLKVAVYIVELVFLYRNDTVLTSF